VQHTRQYGPNSHCACAEHELILWLQEIANEEDLIDHQGHAGVQVLTYHSAKGLEWLVCIYCETTKPTKDRAWGLSVSKAEEGR
jgi:superfamily I DNA/RNA helicase